MDSPSNNTMRVSKRIPQWILHSCSCRDNTQQNVPWTCKTFYVVDGWCVSVVNKENTFFRLCFCPYRLQSCYISCGQFLCSVETICLVHKNLIITHNTCMLMNSFLLVDWMQPSYYIALLKMHQNYKSDEIYEKIELQFINQTPLANVIVWTTETQWNQDFCQYI